MDPLLQQTCYLTTRGCPVLITNQNTKKGRRNLIRTDLSKYLHDEQQLQ